MTRKPRDEVRTYNRNLGNCARTWRGYYRARMNLGLEPCRECGAFIDDDALTRYPEWRRMRFAHIVPHIYGGPSNLGNMTILCTLCDGRQGLECWTHLPSLEQERDGTRSDMSLEGPFRGWTTGFLRIYQPDGGHR